MPDLLPYFALPVVKNPLTHPTFSRIFTQEWVLDIRQQLVDFLSSMYNFEDKPFLVHMYSEYMEKKQDQESGNKMNTQDLEKIQAERQEYLEYVNELENNNRELVDILQDYHNKYKELEDYVKKEGGANGMGTGVSETGGIIIQQKWATFSREILRLANDVSSNFQKKQFLIFLDLQIQ